MSEWSKYDLEKVSAGASPARNNAILTQYVTHKAPDLLTSVIAVFGQTSAGKSAVLNHGIGAYILPSSADACTSEPTLIRGVREATFADVCGVPLADVLQARVSRQVDPWPKPRPDPRLDVGNTSLDVDRYGKLYCLVGAHRSDLFRPIPAEDAASMRRIVFNADLVAERMEATAVRKHEEPLSRALSSTIWVDTAGTETDGNKTGASRAAEQWLLGMARHVIYCLPQDKVDKAVIARFEEGLFAAKGLHYSSVGWVRGNDTLVSRLTKGVCDTYAQLMPKILGGTIGVIHPLVEQWYFSWRANLIASPYQNVRFVQTKLDTVGPGQSFLKYVGRAAVTLDNLKGCTSTLDEVLFVSLPQEVTAKPVHKDLKVYDRFSQLVQTSLRPPCRSETTEDWCEVLGLMYQRATRSRGNLSSTLYAFLPRSVGNSEEFAPLELGKQLKCSWTSSIAVPTKTHES